jgi:hypothetical protein
MVNAMEFLRGQSCEGTLACPAKPVAASPNVDAARI